MRAYLFRRVAYIVPLWIGLSLFSFTLGTLAPGDPAYDLLRTRTGVPPTSEQVERFRHETGLDDPAVVQYGRWLRGAVAGDLGRSLFTGQSVSDRLRRAVPVTLELSLLAFVLTVAFGIPLGVAAALRKGRFLDHSSRVLSLAGASLPSYWKGYLLIILFAVYLDVLPSQGIDSPSSYILPAVTLAIGSVSVLLRLTRGAMLEVLGDEFVLAARARGLPRRRVVSHALRVALNPVVTSAGLLIGGLLAGAVIVETVFSMPGIGKVVVDAANQRDFPVVQGFVLYLGTIVLLINLVIDVLYMMLDPRVRLIEAKRAPRGATAG